MTQQLKYIKKLSIVKSMTSIQPGTSVRFRHSDMSLLSAKAVITRLNRKGYKFHTSAISGNDYFTVTREI